MRPVDWGSIRQRRVSHTTSDLFTVEGPESIDGFSSSGFAAPNEHEHAQKKQFYAASALMMMFKTDNDKFFTLLVMGYLEHEVISLNINLAAYIVL